MSKKCSCVGCSNEPTHEIVVELRNHASEKPHIATVFRYVCAEHKNAVTWNAIILPEWWQKTSSAVTQTGYAKPSRAYSTLAFKSLEKK